MKIGGFQKLTLLDFPGEVACIIFTSGCNFRCPFCHNSELIRMKDEIADDDIFKYLNKRKGVIDGVVISGGEPLMQPDITDFIYRIRNMGFHIKLDTNGSYPGRLGELLSNGLLDYAAMDVKHTRERYSLAAGIDCGEILENTERSIELLKNSSIQKEFRTTFVKGIHEKSDAEEIARWLSADIPYHMQSYINSGGILSPNGLSAFSEQDMNDMLFAAKKHCPNAALRGL